MSQSKWVKCISVQGSVRGVAIEATELMRDVSKRHQIRGIAARGLAEASIGALSISSFCKEGERVNLNVQGSGEFSQALVDAYSNGSMRGYVVERQNPNFQGKGPWGDGMLSVLRTKSSEDKSPYIGTIPLVTGHLAKDLTFYWVQSEQIPSSVGISVQLNDSGQIGSAVGFLIQVLPGATDEEVKSVEDSMAEVQKALHEMSATKDPLSFLSRIFQGTPFEVLEEKPLTFRCDCSWDRVERSLLLVGANELNQMLAEQGTADVTCDFCSTHYHVTREKLEVLLGQLTSVKH